MNSEFYLVEVISSTNFLESRVVVDTLALAESIKKDKLINSEDGIEVIITPIDFIKSWSNYIENYEKYN